MKPLVDLRKPFGQGVFSPVRQARYLTWKDAFEVEFDDGIAFLEPHQTIRKANRIAAIAIVQSVEQDQELRRGFSVHYDNGQTAEVSWAFIRELPPKASRKS
jgi:hypothetical protein